MILFYVLLQTYTWKTYGRWRYQRADQDNGKLLLLCHVPFFQKSIAFCKVSRLRPLVLPVTVTSRWRGVWRIGGMILTVKQENYSERNRCRRRFVHRNFPCVGLRHNPRRHSHRSASNSLSHGKDSVYVIYIYIYTHIYMCIYIYTVKPA